MQDEWRVWRPTCLRYSLIAAAISRSSPMWKTIVAANSSSIALCRLLSMRLLCHVATAAVARKVTPIKGVFKSLLGGGAVGCVPGGGTPTYCSCCCWPAWLCGDKPLTATRRSPPLCCCAGGRVDDGGTGASNASPSAAAQRSGTAKRGRGWSRSAGACRAVAERPEHAGRSARLKETRAVLIMRSTRLRNATSPDLRRVAPLAPSWVCVAEGAQRKLNITGLQNELLQLSRL